MKIKSIILIILSIFIFTQIINAENKKDKKNPPKTKIEEYTYEELNKLFVPTGKQYPALTGDVPVYFDILVKNQPPKYKTEQIGILTISLTCNISKTMVDPNSTAIYQYLKEFAKAKGANVIRVSSMVMREKHDFVITFDFTYEFGKLLEDK